MNVVVEFDVEDFKKTHPEMNNVDDDIFTSLFGNACLLLDNTENSRVQDLNERKLLLYLLILHLYYLSERGGQAVGLMTGASEGNVSASFAGLNNANWYQQTQWGALYWQATAKYRRGVRYIAPSRNRSPL